MPTCMRAPAVRCIGMDDAAAFGDHVPPPNAAAYKPSALRPVPQQQQQHSATRHATPLRPTPPPAVPHPALTMARRRSSPRARPRGGGRPGRPSEPWLPPRKSPSWATWPRPSWTGRTRGRPTAAARGGVCWPTHASRYGYGCAGMLARGGEPTMGPGRKGAGPGRKGAGRGGRGTGTHQPTSAASMLVLAVGWLLPLPQQWPLLNPAAQPAAGSRQVCIPPAPTGWQQAIWSRSASRLWPEAGGRCCMRYH